MLSFELKGSDELEVFCDAEGLDSFVAQLDLLKSAKTDHVHLMSASWGGTHLEDTPISGANATLRHVKIYLMPRATR
jgi:hypothetical protein